MSTRSTLDINHYFLQVLQGNNIADHKWQERCASIAKSIEDRLDFSAALRERQLLRAAEASLRPVPEMGGSEGEDHDEENT